MKIANGHKCQINAAGKQITVYPSAVPDKPVVYLNTFSGEGDEVYRILHQGDCTDFTLVAISGLVWNHDMAPWEIPPIFPKDPPCTGGADHYLKVLTEVIIPKAEEKIPGQVLWRGIAGYSLAGLFAFYSVFQTDLFSRIASMSGSFWFPGFEQYAFSHHMKGRPTHLYFSLGDKECHTKNPYLKSVQENTEKIVLFLKEKGIHTMFQLNPGGHHKASVQRTAAGISWILNQ